MKNEISFFDLDGTLWNIKNEEIWVIDKEKPYKALLTISHNEFALIRAGIYKKDNTQLSYNGQNYFISKELFEIIKKKSGSDNIERFGISFIPLVRKEILDKRELEILTKNIEHLRYNKFVDIGLLTARTNQRNHMDLLNKLRLELKKINIEISKIFFTGEGSTRKDPRKKTYVLLEHLIGLKIRDGKFVPIKQDWYKKVSFYDDDVSCVSYANDIQTYLNDLLRNTDNETFRIIIDRIKENKLTLETNLITNNDTNRFKKNVIILEEPIFRIFQHTYHLVPLL